MILSMKHRNLVIKHTDLTMEALAVGTFEDRLQHARPEVPKGAGWA
jgi:hypothetical protein